jgi:N6-L-threonylcarbamoyladenine synthase
MKQINNLTILAIETSCDDTCAAVLKVSVRKKKPVFRVLASIVSSQTEIHKKWGGVYPSLARREHQRNLPFVLEKALKKIGKQKIDLISVTKGPGLEPCLWAGINFAKKLAKEWNLPIIPVNHIEGHILVNFLEQKKLSGIFPAVCLVVSGGHTQIILMRDFGKYKILGETRDDAAGECFDKAARILGLGYPGGPAIAKISRGRASTNFLRLPRPMLNQKNYDFSFSGLKTAVLYRYKKSKIKNQNYKKQTCKEIQRAIIDVLIKKTVKAARDYRAKAIILGGGVAANDELRKQFRKKFNNVVLPPKKLCTDNAVMTGIAGYYTWLKKGAKLPEKIRAEANLRIS